MRVNYLPIGTVDVIMVGLATRKNMVPKMTVLLFPIIHWALRSTVDTDMCLTLSSFIRHGRRNWRQTGRRGARDLCSPYEYLCTYPR